MSLYSEVLYRMDMGIQCPASFAAKPLTEREVTLFLDTSQAVVRAAVHNGRLDYVDGRHRHLRQHGPLEPYESEMLAEYRRQEADGRPA